MSSTFSSTAYCISRSFTTNLMPRPPALQPHATPAHSPPSPPPTASSRPLSAVSTAFPPTLHRLLHLSLFYHRPHATPAHSPPSPPPTASLALLPLTSCHALHCVSPSPSPTASSRPLSTAYRVSLFHHCPFTTNRMPRPPTLHRSRSTLHRLPRLSLFHHRPVGLCNLPLVRIRNSHLGVAESSFV